MKRKNRQDVLQALMARADDRDFDEREHALFQLALVLERSHPRSASGPDIYSENLDRQLLKLVLSEAEQEEVVGFLARLTAIRRDSRPTCYWALGKAKGTVLLPTLLLLLQAQGEQMDAESAYQAALALCNSLSEPLTPLLIEHLRDHNPRALLEKWSRSKDERLVAVAKKAMDIVSNIVK